MKEIVQRICRIALMGLAVGLIAITFCPLTFADHSFAGFIWDTVSGMRDINDLISTGSGWYIRGCKKINNKGQIIGNGYKNDEIHYCLLNPKKNGSYDIIDLGTNFSPKDINDHGEISGEILESFPLSRPAFRAKNGYIIDIGEFGSGTGYGSGFGINNKGQVVGFIFTLIDSGPQHLWPTEAFIWDKRHGIQEFTAPASPQAIARDINDKGEIIWQDSFFINTHSFFRTKHGEHIDIGSFSEYWIEALGLNNHGVVVGAGLDSDLITRAFKWSKRSGLVDLQASCSDCFQSVARDINKHGLVVGYIEEHRPDAAYWYAFIYDSRKDVFKDLSVDSGFVWTDALGINDRGQVVGSGGFQ